MSEEFNHNCMNCNVRPRRLWIGRGRDIAWVCGECLSEHGAPTLRLLLCRNVEPPADGKPPPNVSAITEDWEAAKREDLWRKLDKKRLSGAAMTPIELRVHRDFSWKWQGYNR